MRSQHSHIKSLQTMAARLSSAMSNRRSVLNESNQIINRYSNGSLNQSFNSPKYVSTQQSFIIQQPTNLSMSLRAQSQSHRLVSPSLRVQTENNQKDDNKQQQFIDATLKLLAQNEKLEKLVCEQNEMIQMFQKDKEDMEMKVKRLSQEIIFLKQTNKKRVDALEKELKQVKGKSIPAKKFIR